MDLSSTERAVLMGMVTYPDVPDRDISSMLDLPNSTYASAKAKILKQGIVKDQYFPIFPKLGFELLVTVFGDFNASIPFRERIDHSRKTVESSPEMILSMGESHRGFSLTVAKNVTRVMKIMDRRIKVLASLNLLEIEHPKQVLFPFQLSDYHRFFNSAPLLHKKLSRMGGFKSDHVRELFRPEHLKRKDSLMQLDEEFRAGDMMVPDLSRTQLEIMYHIIRMPDLSASRLASHIPYSRHTISRVKDLLIQEGYITKVKTLDYAKMGYRILTLYHARLDPMYPITKEDGQAPELLQNDTILFISMPTEMVMLAVYEDYEESHKRMSDFHYYMKNNKHASSIPIFRNHSLPEAIWIKDFSCDVLIRDHFKLDL